MISGNLDQKRRSLKVAVFVKAVEPGVKPNSQTGGQLLEGSGVLGCNVFAGCQHIPQTLGCVGEITDWGGSKNQHAKQTSI